MRQSALVINEDDIVAVALADIGAGDEIELSDGRLLRAASDIPYGHKVALADLSPGDPVVKYGEAIGRATGKIGAGEWVHTHNMGSA